MLLGACLDAGVDLAVVRDAIGRLDLPERVEIGSRADAARRRSARPGRSSAPPSRGSGAPCPTYWRCWLHLEPAVRDAGRARCSAPSPRPRPGRTGSRQRTCTSTRSGRWTASPTWSAWSPRSTRSTWTAWCAARSPWAAAGPAPSTGRSRCRGRRWSSCSAPTAPRASAARSTSSWPRPPGVALMVTLADEFGPLPELRPELVGSGAGAAEPEGHANLTRLVVGRSRGRRPHRRPRGRDRGERRRPRPAAVARACWPRSWRPAPPTPG